MPPLGGGRDFLLVTKTLLFSGQQSPTVDGNYVLAARDKATGDVVAEIPLPARVIGSPMSYETGGKQYIAMTVRTVPPELVAVALP